MLAAARLFRGPEIGGESLERSRLEQGKEPGSNILWAADSTMAATDSPDGRQMTEAGRVRNGGFGPAGIAGLAEALGDDGVVEQLFARSTSSRSTQRLELRATRSLAATSRVSGSSCPTTCCTFLRRKVLPKRSR